MNTLISSQDASVNFVEPAKNGRGMLEARYVRRSDDYFIVYLSSQAGCNLGCRFCHLTATGQRLGDDVTIEDYVRQAETVLAYYDGLNLPAKRVHFNYMARGEALANKYLLEGADDLIVQLDQLAKNRHLWPVHKVSTILPAKTMSGRSFSSVFKSSHPDLYLSLYSVDKSFRRKWLPGAVDSGLALDALADWQQTSGLVPYLHGAYISGENDSDEDILAICREVEKREMTVNINMVRYNPYSSIQGEEPSLERLDAIGDLFRQQACIQKVQLVTRVGVDVKASCGMFVSPE